MDPPRNDSSIVSVNINAEVQCNRPSPPPPHETHTTHTHFLPCVWVGGLHNKQCVSVSVSVPSVGLDDVSEDEDLVMPQAMQDVARTVQDDGGERRSGDLVL